MNLQYNNPICQQYLEERNLSIENFSPEKSISSYLAYFDVIKVIKDENRSRRDDDDDSSAVFRLNISLLIL